MSSRRVLLKLVLADERLVAKFAFEFLFVLVTQDVNFPVIVSHKGLSATFALVRFLVGVSPLMFLQECLVPVRFATFVAFEILLLAVHRIVMSLYTPLEMGSIVARDTLVRRCEVTCHMTT